MPVDADGDLSIRRANGRSRANRMMCRICHELMEAADFIHVTYSCCIHLSCAMGFLEDNATHGGVRRVTCPNPALHWERREILLFSLLEHFRGIAQLVSEADQDTLWDRIAATEDFLSKKTPPPARVGLTRNTIERGEADAES